MAEIEFTCEPVNLDSLREAIAALGADERYEVVCFWARAHDGIGRGSSNWLKHFITQRTEEVRGVRAVELGPVAMLGPAECGGLGDLCAWAATGPLYERWPTVRRYLSECSILFSERAVFGPTGRPVEFGEQARRLAARDDHPPPTRRGTSFGTPPPEPESQSNSNPEGGNDG